MKKAYRDHIFSQIGYTPTAAQVPIHESDARIKLIAGGERGGKALYIDTPIPTPSGWTIVADIKMGDILFDEQGQQCEVIGTTPVMFGHDCYAVKFSDSSTLIADAGHLWQVHDFRYRKAMARRCPNPQHTNWLNVQNRAKPLIMTTEAMSQQLVYKIRTSKGPKGQNGRSNIAIPCTLPLNCPLKELPIEPYVLGVWLGDGHSASATVTTADSEMVNEIVACGYSAKKYSGYLSWGIGCKQPIKDSKTGSFKPNGSLHSALKREHLLRNKHIPSDYLRASYSQRLALLQGLMDSDGYACLDKGVVDYYTTKLQLAQDVFELIVSLGYKATLRVGRAKLNGADKGTKYTIAFTPYSPVFRLPRKRKRLRSYGAFSVRQTRRFVTEVVPIPSVPVKCVQVDSPSHLFLAGRSMIPTHNSKTASIELTLAAANPTTELLWIVGPDYDGAMEEFRYLADDMAKLELLADVSDATKGPLWMKLWNGNRVVTKSAMDFKKLGMQAPGYISMTEAARQEYMAFLRILGRIAERRAALGLSGTFEGASESGVVGSWYAEMFKRWEVPNEDDAQSFSLPSWANLVIFPGGREDPEILRLERTTPPDIFQERYGAVPCKPAGLVLPEFSNKTHVGYFPYDPEAPVDIAIDPGYGLPGAYAVLAIQVKEGSLYLIAEMYVQHMTAEAVINKCKKEWPWFGKISSGAIDVAGKAHPATESQVEIWRKKAPHIYLRTKKVSVEGNVEALRTMLKLNEHGRPNLYVNYNCPGFIAECGGGPSPVSGGGAWVYEPNTGKISDKHCHSTKAMGYYIVNNLGYVPMEVDRGNYGKLLVRGRGGGLRRSRGTRISVGG